ncbi:MAG: ATP-binding protein [Anaerolineales bacterium]
MIRRTSHYASRSLTLKLIRAFLLISITGAVLAAGLARWMTVREFSQLVIDRAQSNFTTTITAYYQTNGSWDGVMEHLRLRAAAPQPPPQQPRPQPQPNPPGGQQTLPPALVFMLANQNGIVVVPAGTYRLGDRVPESDLKKGTPVEVDGQVVGTVIAAGDPPPLDPREERYLTRTNQVLLYSALGAAAAALFLGVLLARTLGRPLRELTTAIREMSKGALKQQVPVRSQDELGELAAAFNQMSADLDRANQLRRQMTADIAHDLRTPLTVLGGYIEAMRDGVLEPTPDRLETMHTEIQHLIRLVEDLRTLSLADAGELLLNQQTVSPQGLLEQTASAFSHRAAEKKIRLQVEAVSPLPDIRVDPGRMAQVLGNLISNALRYTPDGGQITLSAQAQTGKVVFRVRDTGQGIPPGTLPHVFDRFFRGDETREQNGGKSGLGLAIAKSIVELHGGVITVESTPGEGTTFAIVLPAMLIV